MEKEHLPIYGVGPFYGISIIVITIISIILSCKGILHGKLTNTVLMAMFIIVGVLIIIEGIVVFLGADMGGNLIDNIKQNKLKTNGAYKFVRNPCYSGNMLVCVGALFMAHNPWLLILAVVYWVLMTIMLKNSEEKWLIQLYGQEYIEYCKKVNRCIPWFPKEK